MGSEPLWTSNSHKVESDNSLLQNLNKKVTIRLRSFCLPKLMSESSPIVVLEGIIQSI